MIYLTHAADHPVAIVHDAEQSPAGLEAEQHLARRIWECSGIRAKIESDESAYGQSCAKIIFCPLVVGEASGACRYNHCKVHAQNGRISICASNDALFSDAAQWLSEQMRYERGQLQFEDRVDGQSFCSHGLLRSVPCMDAGQPANQRQSLDECEQVIIADTSPDDYSRYLEKMQQDGFDLLERHTIGNNQFARLRRESVGVYVYHTPYNACTRILAEPINNMHTDIPYSGDKDYAALMTVIGARFSQTSRYMNCDSGAGNMGYVFRLQDGRFLLVDGGMDIGPYAERIMQTMMEQAPDPKRIVVACWFLSHTHIDHTGAFLKIAQRYAAELEVQEIACNFPSAADAEIFGEWPNTSHIIHAIEESFPQAKYSKLHTGETLCFGQDWAEVLYTQDDLLRKGHWIAQESWNTSSMCIRLHIGGNTILLPADCDTTANDILLQMYGSYLKSDILQVCHHGGWGGRLETYAAVDPEVAIFSTSDALLPKYLQISYNHRLVYDMHVKEVYNNADRCRTFSLPYHPSQCILPPDPKADILYTEAKQLEALADIERIRQGNTKI